MLRLCSLGFEGTSSMMSSQLDSCQVNLSSKVMRDKKMGVGERY
jgi:hypothetical protein